MSEYSSLFSSLISDVLNKKKNASLQFYSNIPVFSSHIKSLQISEEKDQNIYFIQLIEFILNFCQISDGFSTNILIDNFSLLFPSDPSNKFIESFSSLLSTLIDSLGSFILPSMLRFVPTMKEKISADLIDKIIFPYLLKNINSRESDSASASLVIVSQIISSLSNDNISILLKKINDFSESSSLSLRLAVVDTFPAFFQYDSLLFELVFLKFFNDTETAVKSHFIRTMAMSFSSKINFLFPFAMDPNWKLRYCYIENCYRFIADDAEVEEAFFNLASDKVPLLRSEALKRLSLSSDSIRNQERLLKICLDSFDQYPWTSENDIFISNEEKSHNDVRVGACLLMCKLLRKFPLQLKEKIFELKGEKEIGIMLNGFIPFCSWEENSEESKKLLVMIKKSLKNTIDWRLVLSSIKCISLFLENEGNAHLALSLFGEMMFRFESTNFLVRNECVSQCTKFVKKFGWDFFTSKIEEKINSFLRSDRIRIQRTAVKLLLKLKKIEPPQEINERITACLKSTEIIFAE